MRNRTQYIVWMLLVGLLAFTACQRDELESYGDLPVGEGFYVVNYSPDMGGRTKSVHDHVEKSQRISSLKYLRYNSVNELEKEVDIPDIGPDTQWPLRRETMTWAQREALKDTLRQERSYQVVFVANLEGWKDAVGTSDSNPLREADAYDKAYIQLPDEPFSDNNMFYLFTAELNSNRQDADRDHPYNCPVRLQRIVTRLDFWGEQLPEWKETPGIGEKNPAEDYVHDFSRRLYVQFCFENQNAFVADAVKEEMKNFWTKLEADFEEQAKMMDGALNQESAGTLRSFKLLCQELAEKIPTDTYHHTLFLSDTAAFRLDNTLLAGCMENPSLKERFGQRWEGSSADVLYQQGTSGANRFKLSDWTSIASGQTASVRMPVDTTCVWNERTYNGFTWVGFGRNVDTETSNTVASLRFYGLDGVPSFTLDAKDCTTGQTGNYHYQALYTPIDSMLCREKNAVMPYGFVCDADTLFFGSDPDSRSDEIKAFVKAIGETLLNPATEAVKAYGTDLTKIPLNVQIPDLSAPNTLIVKPRWTVRPVTE